MSNYSWTLKIVLHVLHLRKKNLRFITVRIRKSKLFYICNYYIYKYKIHVFLLCFSPSFMLFSACIEKFILVFLLILSLLMNKG